MPTMVLAQLIHAWVATAIYCTFKPKPNYYKVYLYWVDNLDTPHLGVYKTPPGEAQMGKITK